MAVYQADDYAVAGMFLHQVLAVRAPQFVVDDPESEMANIIDAELNRVYSRSRGPIDLRHWRDWLAQRGEA